MLLVENECCGCATDNYPCRGERCELRHVRHYLCDNCQNEDTLYYFDGKELCLDCIEERLEVVEGSDYE